MCVSAGMLFVVVASCYDAEARSYGGHSLVWTHTFDKSSFWVCLIVVLISINVFRPRCRVAWTWKLLAGICLIFGRLSLVAMVSAGRL